MEEKQSEFVVTPWEVTGDIDYDKLIEKFGTSPLDPTLLERIKSHTGELHFMLRRRIFYSHRSMNWILTQYEKGNPFVLYTGRGPSGNTHLGHLMPWVFTRWLQEKFGARLLFQLTDDEKFLFNPSLGLEDTRRYSYENALDIIALGFDPEKTDIFLNTEYINHQYRLALQAAKRITFSTAKAVFGFQNDNNIGLIFFTSMQSAPCFLESERQGKQVPVLIPCAIDQDPHFRVTRDIAPSVGYPKPALIHCKFFPSMAGGDKMSASMKGSSIYTTDHPAEARKKIMNAFTGGKESAEQQREEGGKPEVCSIYQYLYYFFEASDEEIKKRYSACNQGHILCGECKNYLAELVEGFLLKHQEKREEAREKLEDFIVRD